MANTSWLEEVVNEAAERFNSLQHWEQEAINNEIALIGSEAERFKEHENQELHLESA